MGALLPPKALNVKMWAAQLRGGDWSDWGACSRTSGVGEMTRTRRGGEPYPPIEERCRCGSACSYDKHTSTPLSASLLSRLTTVERRAGWCLPIPLEAPSSPIEVARRRLRGTLPGVSDPIEGCVSLASWRSSCDYDCGFHFDSDGAGSFAILL